MHGAKRFGVVGSRSVRLVLRGESGVSRYDQRAEREEGVCHRPSDESSTVDPR